MKNKKEDKYHEYIELIHQNTLIKDDKRLKECLKGKTKISECFFLAILDRQVGGNIQHYVNKLEDSWLCKDMIA